ATATRAAPPRCSASTARPCARSCATTACPPEHPTAGERLVGAASAASFVEQLAAEAAPTTPRRQHTPAQGHAPGARLIIAVSPLPHPRMTHAPIEGPSVTVRRALLSVSDKTGLVELAQALAAHGVELLSTGGTAKALRDAGLAVKDVSDVTGFPEMMDGRVKTLHPKVHGGLLGRAGLDDAVMAEHGIGAIDLLVLNLYPFARVAANPDSSFEDVIENIVIGGPAMLRSAAKNFARVAVATAPAQYAALVEEMNANAGALSAKTRWRLAVAAFNDVAYYDACIGNHLSSLGDDGAKQLFPAQANGSFVKVMDLRYGENPHQQAAFY